MSAFEAQEPIYRIRCDHDGCDAEFEAVSQFGRRFGRATRNEAGQAGWDVPSPRGKGSRRDTDFCPQHAETVLRQGSVR